MAKTKTISKGCPKCEQQVIILWLFILYLYDILYINFIFNIL